MNLQALVELRNRLEASAVAGVQLAEEDFRLKRAVEQMQPLAQASPVFAKIHAQAVHLTAPGEADRAGRLLNTLALADAVLCTQGQTGADSSLSPLDVSSSAPYKPLRYSTLAPLLEALTGTGGGRYNIVKEAIEENNALLQDYRLRNALVGALHDSYAELAELAADYLSSQGPEIVPLLKRDFDPLGKKDMARRVKVIGQVAGAAENAWYLDMLQQKCDPAIRCELLENLRFTQENETCLFDFVKSERGNAKKSAMKALAYMDTPATAGFFTEKLKKDAGNVAAYLSPIHSAWISDVAAQHLLALLEETLLSAELPEERYTRWNLWLDIAQGKDSARMREFYNAASAHSQALSMLKLVHNKDSKTRVYYNRENLSLDEAIGNCMARTAVQLAPPALLELALELWKREPCALNSGAALVAALLTLPAAQAYETFFADDGASVRRLSRAQWESGGRKQLWRFMELLVQKDGQFALLNWFTYSRESAWKTSHPIREALDPRWFTVMTDWEIARTQSGNGYQNYDVLANTIADTGNEQVRRTLISAFRAHAKQKPYLHYFDMLSHLDDRDFRGLLAPFWASERYLSAQSMLQLLATSSMTQEEQAAEMQKTAEFFRNKNVKAVSRFVTVDMIEDMARQLANGIPVDKINV